MVESPYAGEVPSNLKYLRECIDHCRKRGEAPFASHGIYPIYLDDLQPDERTLGLAWRDAWAQGADVVRFYVDRGVSAGMWHAFQHAVKFNYKVEAWTIRGEAETQWQLAASSTQLSLFSAMLVSRMSTATIKAVEWPGQRQDHEPVALPSGRAPKRVELTSEPECDSCRTPYHRSFRGRLCQCRGCCGTIV
jgi:hypothetical protein